MPVYLVSSYNIHNYETYKNYPPRIAPLIARYGGKALTMEMNPESLQGKAKNRHTIIEFPSEEAIKNMYNDSEYESIIYLRDVSTSDCTMVIVKGFERG
jgi:uncharacterized protein (DUF1330 family)